MVEPLLRELGDQERRLCHGLLRHQHPPVRHADVQPLAKDLLLAALLRAAQEVDGEKLEN